MEALEKSFTAYMLIKSATDEGGQKYLHGPAALVEEDGLGSDFDKDDLAKAAVEGGLKTFERLGGQVDWDHLYAKTHDPKHIIGKCVDIKDNPSGGAPIVTTQLFMSKPLAKSAWEHHEAGGVLGYSLQGIAKARDPHNAKRITSLDIHMLTITPMPKGFEGPRLSAGDASLGAIVKGLNAELEAGLTEGWETVEEIEPIEKAAVFGENCPHCGAALERGDDGKCNHCRKTWPTLDNMTDEERYRALNNGESRKDPAEKALMAGSGTDDKPVMEKAVACPICANGGKRDEQTKTALLGVSPKEIPDGHRYIAHEGKAYCVDHMAGSDAFGSFEPHEKYGLPDQSFKMKVKKGVSPEADKAESADSLLTKAAEAPDQELAGKIRASFQENNRVKGNMVNPTGTWVHVPVTHNGVTQHFIGMQRSISRMGNPVAIHLRQPRKTSNGSPYLKDHKLDSKGKLTSDGALGSVAHEYPPLMDIQRTHHDQFQKELHGAESILRAGIDKHNASQTTPKTRRTSKALMAGSGVVQAGDTGGSVLRKQDLMGADKAKQHCGCASSKCSCASRKRKKKRTATEFVNKSLVAELALHGVSNPLALSRQITQITQSR